MRHSLYTIKLNQPTDDNINKYKKYTFIYKKLLRIAKQTYYSDQLEEAKYDMKKTWSILKKATNTQGKLHSLPDYFISNNTKLTNKKEIVDTFNTFFTNIGKTISNEVPITDKPYTQYLNQPHHNSIFFNPVTPIDIVNIVSKLKSKTSQGHDDISTKLTKQTIHFIATPLSHIINQSMLTGIVPLDMKLAKVIPIFKSSDQHSFNNYRPISILPAFSKVIEKL